PELQHHARGGVRDPRRDGQLADHPPRVVVELHLQDQHQPPRHPARQQRLPRGDARLSDWVDIGGGNFNFRISVVLKRFDGMSWSSEVVESDLQTNSRAYSLALDANDEPHLTWYSWSDDELVYAWHAAGAWHTEVV